MPQNREQIDMYTMRNKSTKLVKMQTVWSKGETGFKTDRLDFKIYGNFSIVNLKLKF